MINSAQQRTQRLLRSFNELEREVRGRASQESISTLQLKVDTDPFWDTLDDFGDEWWDCWDSRLRGARRMQVPENDLTEEFREARGMMLDLPLDADDDWWDEKKNWAHYQLRCGSRHKWGQYLRSNMDWDWDLGGCLDRLFRLEKQIQVPNEQTVPASSPAIDVSEGSGGTLKI